MNDDAGREEAEEERRCEACGGPYDQAPIDSFIPVCVACQLKASRGEPLDADRPPG